ncbi:hypothetical protein NADFUDRAFT_53683 [Nadsonia fulvescens var. elongata DSM 6958]|uniref:Ribosomal protein S21 n=1 Tax=Nadsonia fulvescens var. elongata DSM 6958 TaxID=857566 RepID=A0A1E3PDG1_9ASCO|nr:hypothetical protein NADFUDRAFT_53683 [Nadsonia fulvescens var. elongata DSM 6958]
MLSRGFTFARAANCSFKSTGYRALSSSRRLLSASDNNNNNKSFDINMFLKDIATTRNVNPNKPVPSNSKSTSSSSSILNSLRLQSNQNSSLKQNNMLEDAIALHPESSPRTGLLRSRTVSVSDPGSLKMNLGVLNSMAVRSGLRQAYHSFKEYEKPTRKRKRVKSMRHRKKFMVGFKRLMDLVHEAKRKGF